MPKFLCLQRSLPGAPSTKPTSEQMQQMYAQFGAWQEKYKAYLTDMGGKLGDGKLVSVGGADASTDAVPAVKDLAGGYMIVTASSLEEAIEVANACPGLVRPGSGVEVIEIQTP